MDTIFHLTKYINQTTLIKLNTDAAIRLGEQSFSVGLVLRDHHGQFIMGKVCRLAMVSSVLEAEVTAIQEALAGRLLCRITMSKLSLIPS